MFDAIFGRSVKILKILAKVQCVLAFVLASMLCGAVHEMLKPINQFSAIVLGLVVAVAFWVLQMFLAWAVYAFAELIAGHPSANAVSDLSSSIEALLTNTISASFPASVTPFATASAIAAVLPDCDQ